MADHHHDLQTGHMDIREQQKTYAGFVRFGTWVVILAILVLIFLALSNA